jgi:hypothetical protein
LLHGFLPAKPTFNFTDLASTVVVPFSSPFPQVLCWQSDVKKYYRTLGKKSDDLLKQKVLGTVNKVK